jgi:hypothetical protein
MSRRTSFTDRRRARLARRVESLEAMESRSLITESLGILAAGIGFGAATTALAGTRRPVAQLQAPPAALALTPRNFPALLAPSAPVPVASPAASAPATVSPTVPAAIAVPAAAGDWLNLTPIPVRGQSFTGGAGRRARRSRR